MIKRNLSPEEKIEAAESYMRRERRHTFCQLHLSFKFNFMGIRYFIVSISYENTVAA